MLVVLFLEFITKYRYHYREVSGGGGATAFGVVFILSTRYVLLSFLPPCTAVQERRPLEHSSEGLLDTKGHTGCAVHFFVSSSSSRFSFSESEGRRGGIGNEHTPRGRNRGFREARYPEFRLSRARQVLELLFLAHAFVIPRCRFRSFPKRARLLAYGCASIVRS